MTWWRKQAPAGRAAYYARLDKVRMALKKDPRCKPPFDPDTASYALLLNFVFEIAEELICGDFDTRLQDERLKAARAVAAHFGAEIVPLEDGSLSVEPGKDHVPPPMVH